MLQQQEVVSGVAKHIREWVCEHKGLCRASAFQWKLTVVHVGLLGSCRWCQLCLVVRTQFDCAVRSHPAVIPAKRPLPRHRNCSSKMQDKVKAEHKELLRHAAALHPPAKLAAYLRDALMESKNNRSRVVAAEELGGLVALAPELGGGPPVYMLATKAGGWAGRERETSA
jgi:hypothetical protein